jgi:hypothetical protein
VYRTGHLLLAATSSLFLLTGCAQNAPSAPSGASAQEVVDNLNSIFPVGNQRDNTEACTSAGCERLITTDSVSVYRMRDESTAAGFAEGLGDAIEQVGPFVLSYSGSQQQLTPREVRVAYADRIRTLLTR